MNGGPDLLREATASAGAYAKAESPSYELTACCVGPGAGELIAEGALAVETAMLAEDLALTIHTHPTLSETLMEAAETLLR